MVYHDRLETLPQAALAQENFDSVKKLSLHCHIQTLLKWYSEVTFKEP